MLHKMTFQLSSKVVITLDNNTAKASLYNQGGIASLSRLACILNLANVHGISVIAAYVHTHLDVNANYHGEGWFQSGTFMLT